MEPLFFIVVALIIGAATRHFLSKTPLPYTVLLMIFGLILGLLSRQGIFEGFHAMDEALHWAGHIDPHVILFIFLPILIFEAAFAMDVHTFKKTVANASILAVPGIILALLLTGVLVMGINNLELGFKAFGWNLAFLFGAVISATDPVAVVALLKELGASKKLGTLIEGESLLNDGTAIVLFFVFLATIPGIEVHGGDMPIVMQFLKVSFGGILLGLVIGGAVLLWVKKVFNDAMIEITLIVVAAYLTFYIAEHFLHVSGVLGLVALGLAMASAGRTRISAEVQHFLHEFWELAAFIANTLIFVIVGVVIAERIEFTAHDFISLFILYIGLHLIRGIMVAIGFPFMKNLGYGLNKKEAVILVYGGLRGAVGLALALYIAGEENLPEEIRSQFLFYVAGIVALTLLINATTIKFIINKLGLTHIPPVKVLMFSNAYRAIHRESEKELEVIKKDRFMSGADWSVVKNYILNKQTRSLTPEELASMDPVAEARRRILEREKRSYWNQFKEGLLGSMAFTKLSDNINEILDLGGSVPLNERPYLENLFRTNRFLSLLSKIPIISGWAKSSLLERLAISYDIARGFVSAQEEVNKLASSMDYDFNQDDQTDESEKQMKETIMNEISANRIKALTYIKDLHIAYPEITQAIETRQAARTVLNYEKNLINKLNKEGRLEDDEANRLITDVELRMKKLMETPLITALPEPREILKNVSWLAQLPDIAVQKVLAIATEKQHNTGETLIQQGDSGDKGMVIIARGSVKITVNDMMVDVLGAGSVIGEMSVLANVPRTASVIAETPVIAFWLSSRDMQSLFKEVPELEEELWQTAGMRFAENNLGMIHPYRDWTILKLRRWLRQGKVVKTTPNQVIDFHNRVGFLITGAATDETSKRVFSAPAILDAPELVFAENSRVFISDLIQNAEE